jgi:hypothetical protein
MKKKFKMLMAYLKGFKKDSINFELAMDETIIQETNIYDDVNMTSNFESYFDSIVEPYISKLYDEGPGSVDSASNYFRVMGEILPFENKITFNNIEYWEYGTESSGSEYSLDDYEESDNVYNYFLEIREFLNRINSDSATLTYNGGGDDGSIDSQYKTPNGGGPVPDGIKDIAYKLLSEFGGWEINEGSQGQIYLTKDKIEIDHEWNTENSDSVETDLTITEDSLL